MLREYPNMASIYFCGIPTCLCLFLLLMDTHEASVFTGSTNIAFGKPTKQYPYDLCSACHQWVSYNGRPCDDCSWSRRAVDGNADPDTSHGHCSHTDTPSAGSSASWSVDLQGLYFLSLIKITNRLDVHDCCRKRLKGFSIHGYPGNHLIYQNNDNSYLHDVINVTVSLRNTKFSNITISLPAQRGKRAILTLCEVQIFLDQGLRCTVPNLDDGNIQLINGFTTSNFIPIGTSISGNVEIGSTLQFTCDRGYKLSGSRTSTCGINGNWEEAIPTCSIVTCGSPSNIVNGYWSPKYGYCLDYQCTLRFMCNAGFHKTSMGDVSITCGENGTWSHWNEKCEAVVCNVPDGDTTNVLYETPQRTVNVNTIVIAKCREGFNLSRGSFYRICKEDGSFSGLEPNCTIVQCAVPITTLQFGSVQLPRRLVFQSVINSQCNAGFKLKYGNLKRVCQADGSWSGLYPVCERIVCLRPNTTSSGTYTKVLQNGTEEILNEDQDKHLLYSFNTTLKFYCNGALKSTDFNVRICLVDSTWSGQEPACDGGLHKDSNRSRTSGIIGGLVGGLALLLIVISAGIFLLSRRKRMNSSGENTEGKCVWFERKRDQLYSNVGMSSTRISHNQQEGMEYSTIEQIPETSTQVSDIETSYDLNIKSKHDTDGNKDLQHTYYNTSSFEKKSSTAIMLEDLADIVSFGKELEYMLESQFNELPSGMTRSHKIALRSENSKKNRYKQIYAYDDNRVVLEHKGRKEDTDYINASFIHGYSIYREYIASQGPTKEMVQDFWRMIWQVDSSKIIMLTKLIEKEKLSGAERTIRQFHFTAWPDKGVPQYTSAIVHFQNKVKKLKTTGSGPTIVHCSAGIGRTGTYIALDILTEQGKHEDYVDIASCVGALRRQRVNMVQTLDQYIFLHSTLAEALMLSSSAVSTAKFTETYHDLLEVDPIKRRRKIEVAFDMLKHMSPVVDEQQYVSAKEVRNRKRNRYSNILPVSEYMPQIQESSKDGYINAVFLPSYKDRKALILTQMPLKNTKDDFWALVQKHDVHTIVMLNTVNEAEPDEVYWPEESHSKVYGGIEITTTNQEHIGKCIVVTMELEDGNSVKTLKQIQCQFWEGSQKIPDSCSDVIETIELVQRMQQQSGNHPVVVHCMNGVDRSGLFCVISAVIERLRVEQDVAITQIIEQMRCARDQIVPSVEQFQFCHEVILTYIQQFSEYSNFSTI